LIVITTLELYVFREGIITLSLSYLEV